MNIIEINNIFENDSFEKVVLVSIFFYIVNFLLILDLKVDLFRIYKNEYYFLFFFLDVKFI